LGINDGSTDKSRENIEGRLKTKNLSDDKVVC